MSEPSQETTQNPAAMDAASLYTHLRDSVADKTIECALLDRSQSGSSKYRAVTTDELSRLLPKDTGIVLS